MVMLEDEDCVTQKVWEHNKKIADYLNSHPMFRDAEPGRICKENFYEYIADKLERVADDSDRLHIMTNAIWFRGEYTKITEDDCDWFFDQVEPLWCEFHNVPSSGFFEPSEPLPIVPNGLLKIPVKL